LKISGRKERDLFIFEIEGRLDSSNSLDLEEQFDKWIEQGERKFIGDFSRLEFLSSAGLRALIQALKRVTPDGGNLVLCNMRGIVSEIFNITGLGNAITIVNDKASAIACFK